ncbi:MAG: DUF1553 domain-containing protein [Planctomycetaceae bacterium]
MFGRGIVSTSEEFGSQGDLRAHQKLLDWLSRTQWSRWNTKALLRLIVTSATYRQSARVSSEAAASDPDNRWLARGPRVRLSAEMVRDQALLAPGLLKSKRCTDRGEASPQPEALVCRRRWVELADRRVKIVIVEPSIRLATKQSIHRWRRSMLNRENLYSETKSYEYSPLQALSDDE